MVAPETRPLVICNTDGFAVDVALQNEKAFRKSLENGTLWSVHPETGRVLPYGDGPAATVEDRGTWYRAVLTTAGAAAQSVEPTTQEQPAVSGTPAAMPGNGAIGNVLTALAALIHERREELPEGSYTTHLFAAGGDKIRKKTGEEAVELILARDRAEITSEASDLIYHLLVLLEVEGISLDEIAAELKRR